MEIMELENRHVRLGKTSITVKDEAGKTRGIVRNVWKFSDLQPNKQIDYLRKIDRAGIWGTVLNNTYMLDNVIIKDGEIYYFNNLRPLESYRKLIERVNAEDLARFYAGDTEHYNKRQEIVERCAEQGIHVINCYID